MYEYNALLRLLPYLICPAPADSAQRTHFWRLLKFRLSSLVSNMIVAVSRHFIGFSKKRTQLKENF